ncbi:hypothetical protein HAX54_033170, partial [Datura stramonium]|nr:hypothetical protein [Datura stramonium]
MEDSDSLCRSLALMGSSLKRISRGTLVNSYAFHSYVGSFWGSSPRASTFSCYWEICSSQ